MSAGNLPSLPLSFLRIWLVIGSLCGAVSPAFAAAATTTTTLAITSGGKAATKVAAGQAVTFTATVLAGAAHVTAGTVNFCDATAIACTDIHLLGSASLNSGGTAQLTLVPPPGARSYKAEFHGTQADAASSSSSTSLAVISATAATITQSGSAGNYTLKAIVTGKGNVAEPTGKASFLDTSNQNAVLGTAVLGTATEAFTWANPQSPATAAAPQSIVVVDFNGDGIADIAVGTNGTAGSNNIGSVNILLGNGDGTFQAAKTYAGLTGNQLIVAAPFVTGGPDDILAVNNSTSTTNNALLSIGDGKGGLTVGTPFSLGVASITALITGDFNGDGKQDFIVAGKAFGVPAFDVVLGNGNGTFSTGTLSATGVAITALGAGDFTGQGALDVAVVHSDGSVDIFLQDGVGDFSPNVGTQTGSSPTAIAVGDFNGDGKADLAITNSAQDSVSILLGNGSGGFTAAASPGTGATPKAIAVGDFNGDGIADLAVANSGADTVTVLLGKGDGTFTVEPVLDTGNTPVSLAIGAFNGSDTSDIAVANEDPASNSSTSTATILLAQPTQTATATASGVAPADPGTHLVDASYPGDGNYAASVSATITLTGSGSSTSVSVAPTSLTFSSQKVGATSTAQAVKLTNTGQSALSISSVKASTNFAVSSACGSSLAVGANCLLSVTFVPTVVGSITGSLTITDNATGSSQTVILTGTATAASTTSELQFISINPCRIADTRNANGAFGGPELAAASTRTFTIPQSACGIPSTAAAYALNATVVPGASLGYLTVWPAGQAQPTVSTLNSDGRVKANATITPAGTKGGVSVFASDATQFILDIDGYFVPIGISTAALEFFPLTPCRIADTRNATGALGGPSLGAATSRAFPVLSSSCGIPVTAKVYSLNVTAVPHGSLGFLTAWPSGESQPVVSTLNASTGAVTANAAIVPAGTGGEVSIYVSDASDVILDVNGYFAPPASGGLSLYTVAPCRAIDTRSGAGAFNGTLTVPLHGSSCAPPATAQAYVLNATVVPTASLSFLSLWAAGKAQPVVSTLNASDGAVTSNMAIVPTTNGSIDAFASDSTNLILDIASYFAP
jgi:hypothetical protein